MRILFLSQYYHPDITAAAFRISETAELLARNNHNVYVITAIPHKGVAKNLFQTVTLHSHKTGFYRPDSNHSLKKEFSLENNVIVTRVPIITCAGHGLVNYIKHYFSFMINSILRSFSLPSKFDVVLASSPPLFAGLAGFIISKLKKAKFILDIRDIWPDSAVTAKQLQANSLAYKLGKYLEIFLYVTANKITCVSQPMAEYIYSSIYETFSSTSLQNIVKNFANIHRPYVIYNGVLEKYINLIENEEKKLQNQSLQCEIYKIIYAGNLGHVQNIEILLDAAKMLLQNSIYNVKIEIIGAGVKQNILEEKIKELKLYNILLSPPIPKQELYKKQLEASALLLLLVEDKTMEKTIPSKLFDYLALGKPIIYCIKGEGQKILQESGSNIEFNSNCAQSLVDAIYKLINNYSTLLENAKLNREILKSKFTRERAVKELENIIVSS